MSQRILVVGQEIRWRTDSYARRWKIGFVVDKRGPWIVVRIPSGDEIDVHPHNVKALDE